MQTAASDKPRSRRALVLCFLGFSALIAVLFGDVVFGGRVISGRDVVPFFLPIEKAVHTAWRHGRLPLILPEISFGRALAANPNTGVFYPVRIALAALPFPVAFRAFPLIHLALAGAGMFWFATAAGLSTSASALAAISYGLSGPAVGDTQFVDFLPGIALLPWVLGAASRLCRRPAGRSAAFFSLLLAIDFLAGDLFTSFLAVGGAVLWTMCCAERPRRAYTRLAMAIAVAGLVSGIQIVPALAFTPLTIRGLGRFPLSAALNWSMSLWRLLELLVPFPFGNVARDRAVWAEALWYGKSVGFYQTLFCGTLASLGILMAAGSKVPHRRFVLAFGSVSLGLAAIGFYLPKAMLSHASPLPLRYPEKFAVGLTLAAALAAGVVWDEARNRNWRVPAASGAAIGLLLLLAALVVRGQPALVAELINRHWSPIHPRGIVAASNLPAILAAGAGVWLVTAGIVFLLARGYRRSMAIGAAILLAADLAVVARAMLRVDRWQTITARPPSARAVARETARGAFSYLPLQEYFSAPGKADPLNVPMEMNPDDVFGYLEFFSAASFGIRAAFNSDYDISDFYRVELARRELERDDAAWSGVQGYVTAFSARAALVEAGRLPAGFPKPRATIRPAWLVTNPAALPVVRFASIVREVANIRQAYDLIHSRTVDLSKETVVESGRSDRRTSAVGKIHVLEFSPSAVRCDTDAASDGRLLIVRAFSPFRSAFVDGRAVEYEAADLCLTSVATPAGRHRVEIVERLPGGAAGPLMSAAGLLAIGVLGMRRESRRP